MNAHTAYSRKAPIIKATKKVFIIFLIAFGLAGCAAAKDENMLTVWHWMSDREPAFQELAARFEKETGIKVRFDLYAPSEAYAQRVKASAQTNTLPDIFGVLGEKKDFASFIRSGYIADLTVPLSEPAAAGESPWREQLFEKALAVNEFLPENEYGVPSGVYGVPLDVMTIQMVYNQSMYEKAGLDPSSPPTTWDEFLSHARTLKQKGLPGFVSGFGEIWLIDAFASNLAMNLMGEEKVFDTYRGKVPYTDPQWVRLFGLLQQLTQEKILVEGAVTMVNKSAEQTFANERAAYAFNGSWCINVYKGMNPGLKYAAMLPPKLTPQNPVRIWGGAGTSFVVNEKSPRKEKAVQFLKWLTSTDPQTFLAEATENLPSNKNSVANLSPILAQFADDMDNTTHPNLYPVHESYVVTETMAKGIQSILIGEKTPEQVAQDVQKAKDKESRKAER